MEKESHTSDIDFYYKYIELINQGYSDDSPEMMELFKQKANFKSNNSKPVSKTEHRVRSNALRRSSNNSEYVTNANQKTNTAEYHTNPNTHQKQNNTGYRANPNSYQRPNNTGYKTNPNSYQRPNNTEYSDNANLSHIIIDMSSGNYSLLDANLNVVDSIHSNPFLNLFTKKFKLKKFKKQLKADLANYKYNCKIRNLKPNSDFLKLHKQMKFYLRICPDADYQILELLRKNISKINPYYKNYQTACEEYLHELACLRDGDPENLSFDINYFGNYDEFNANNHKYFSKYFKKSSDPVKTFRASYTSRNTNANEFRTQTQYTPSYTKTYTRSNSTQRANTVGSNSFSR